MAETLEAKDYFIVYADYGIVSDEKDEKILEDRFKARHKREGPRVGDYVIFTDKVVHRFSHDWEKQGMQTSENGSYHLSRNGYISMSGGLNPCVKRSKISYSGEDKLGRIWFFHHGYATAHAGVYADIMCRIYHAACKSTHWHRKR